MQGPVRMAVAAAVGVAIFAARAGGQELLALPARSVWRGIQEVGFPAAAFVMLWLMMSRQIQDNTRALQELVATIRELRGALCRGPGK